MLPDESGLELCRQVRARITDRHVPIIVVSVAIERQIPRDSLAAGADDFVG